MFEIVTEQSEMSPSKYVVTHPTNELRVANRDAEEAEAVVQVKSANN